MAAVSCLFVLFDLTCANVWPCESLCSKKYIDAILKSSATYRSGNCEMPVRMLTEIDASSDLKENGV